MEYTRLTNLEVTGHLKVAGQEVTPGGGGGGGGSSTLSGLTDVDISNPTDGQTLVYNAESGKWENGAGGGSGLVVTANEFNSGEYAQLDKTAGEIYTAFVNGKPISFRQIIDNSEDDVTDLNYIMGELVTLEYSSDGNQEYFNFTLGRSGNNSFYEGEYACIGRDGYPVTNFAPPQ